MPQAEVIDIRSRRLVSATAEQRKGGNVVATTTKPAQRDERFARICEFRPPQPTKTNAQNRYDAAFKGYMMKRSRELCRELQAAIGDYNWPPLTEGSRKARVQWVIAEIRRIADEVAHTTPEHFPTQPAGA